MTKKSGDSKSKDRANRDVRRARALRANLARRKAQVRAREQAQVQIETETTPPRKPGA